MSNNLQHVQKFSRAAALISPQHAQELTAIVNSPERNADSTLSAIQSCASGYGIQGTNGKPFIFASGVAIIPVWGALLHRDPWCDAWATGYDYLTSRAISAIEDNDVKGIVWDINSYGGHVAGNFELCDMIYKMRSRKPMISIVDSRSLSGGYSIGSSVGRMVATPSADIGSVGVVLMHMSIEKALENYGMEVTFIHAGKHKVDGNPFEKLPDDVKDALQASVNRSYDQFVSLVARNRGMKAEDVRATEARVYDADEAKTLGLIDDVMSPRAAFASFVAELQSSTQPKKAKNMSTDTNNGAGEEATRKAELDAAKKQAVTDDRARMQAITSSEEAKTRPALAHHLAQTTDMSADAARAVLAAAAPETPVTVVTPPAAKGPLATAMGKEGGSGVEATDTSDAGEGVTPAKGAIGDRISKTYAKQTGNKLRSVK